MLADTNIVWQQGVRMIRQLARAAGIAAAAAALAGAAAACGGDDGEDRPVAVIGSGTGTASGSVSGSVTGITTAGLAADTDNPLVRQAVDGYRAYLLEQTVAMIAATTAFTDAIRAGDLAAAQAAYAPSRVAWERIEPIAGLIEAIDGAVDARVDDFAGPDDPGFTGWHRLEYILFELGTTEGAAPFADRLDADLRTLASELPGIELPPAVLAIGAAELIEEVSEGKITGEEDRYSKTDLWDFNANLEGSQALIGLLAPALREADPQLLADIEAGFGELNATLAPLRDGGGWAPFCQENDEFPSPICEGAAVIGQDTIDLLKAQLAGLSERISLTAGALGLS